MGMRINNAGDEREIFGVDCFSGFERLRLSERCDAIAFDCQISPIFRLTRAVENGGVADNKVELIGFEI